MGIDSIIASNSLNGGAGKTDQSLGKDDFLQLFVKQLQNQDPLNPMDNQAMLAQMAQFSSVEQMSNLNDNFAQANQLSAFMDATRLLGKDIELSDPTAPGTDATLTARVDSISQSANGPILKLSNGMNASVSDVIKVSEPQS